ncbi:hypothetical protein [Paraflavitalea speifideaquila]|uniref:hypothetical protein n=1 Tax=Paraflavitalea speifideaquila TaxID=3076558 RepID=UPI0028E23A59|nr:hypothetical protein [Paraflavitalea speifideiaquila]
MTIAYAACFGVEITVDNFAASYFHDEYSAGLIMAGLMASIFGWLNIFARAIGGIVSDKVGNRFGFNGKVNLLTGLLLLEGIGIILFAKAGSLGAAIALLFFLVFALKWPMGLPIALCPLSIPMP